MITEIKMMATFALVSFWGSFAALTEGGILTMTNSLIGFFGVVFSGIMLYLTARLNKIEKVGKDTHTLVNSNMGVELKSNRDLTAWKAWTTKDAADIAAADASEKKYQEHVAKQAVVDSGIKTS